MKKKSAGKIPTKSDEDEAIYLMKHDYRGPHMIKGIVSNTVPCTWKRVTVRVDALASMSDWEGCNMYVSASRTAPDTIRRVENNAPFIAVTDNIDDTACYVIIEGNHRVRHIIRNINLHSRRNINFYVGVVPQGQLLNACNHLLK